MGGRIPARLRRGAHRSRRPRQDRRGCRVDDREALRRRVQLPAVPVQHRGHLLQQGDLRGERLGRSRDVGRPPDRRSRGQGRRPHRVRRFGRAGLAAHASGQRLPVPHARRRRLAEGRRRRREAHRPRVRRGRAGDRRPRCAGLLRQQRRLARLRRLDQRVPHRQGRDDLHGQLAAGQHQRRRQPDRGGQRRLHALPRRRRRRGLDRGVPVQCRPSRHLRREDLQPGRRRVAGVHHRELRQRGAQAGSDHRLHRR